MFYGKTHFIINMADIHINNKKSTYSIYKDGEAMFNIFN